MHETKILHNTDIILAFVWTICRQKETKDGHYLGGVYVGDVKDATDKGANAKQSDGEIGGVTAADLRQEAAYTGAEKVQTQRPLAAQRINHQQRNRNCYSTT